MPTALPETPCRGVAGRALVVAQCAARIWPLRRRFLSHSTLRGARRCPAVPGGARRCPLFHNRMLWVFWVCQCGACARAGSGAGSGKGLRNAPRFRGWPRNGSEDREASGAGSGNGAGDGSGKFWIARVLGCAALESFSQILLELKGTHCVLFTIASYCCPAVFFVYREAPGRDRRGAIQFACSWTTFLLPRLDGILMLSV